MTPPTGLRHSHASQQVLEFLRAHANTDIPYTEINKAINAVHPHTASNAVGYLISRGIDIVRPMKGVARYRTGPAAVEESVPQFPRPTSARLWEEVGTAGEAGVLIRDEMGRLYLAREIKEILT